MNLPLNTLADTSNATEHARYNMIEQQIRPWNVLDADVLQVLAQVKREDFVPPAHQAATFTDTEIPLQDNIPQANALGQLMLAPRVSARMLQDLAIQPTDRVLEVGTGSGYMAALLAQRAKHVISLEIDPDLVEFARENLRSAGFSNVEVRHADAAKTPITDGPFDAIVLSGSVAQVPQKFLDLLAPGGRLSAIVGQQPMMRATVVTRSAQGFTSTQAWDVVITRLRGFAEPSNFQF